MFGELVGAALADCWTARRVAGATRSMPSLGRAAERWPRDALRVMRARGLRRRRAFGRDQPGACARRRRAAVPGRALARRSIDDLPAAAAAARRQRIPRRAADPPACRRASSGASIVAAGGLAFDRDGEIVETSPARDDSRRRDRQPSRRATAASALIVDYGHARQRAGRHAPGGARPPLRAGARPTRASRI